jgi:hypothetical protein
MPNPRAAGTTTEMIVRMTNSGGYWVYDLGANTILTSQTSALFDPASIGGTAWDFAGSFDAANSTAVGGAVEWNLSTTNMQDFYLRNKLTGALAIYEFNASTNTFVSGSSLGTVGLDWKTVGFAYINGNGQADFILSNTNAATQQTDYKIYNIANQQLQDTSDVALIGSNWKPLGVGPDASTFGSTHVDLLVVRADQLTSSLPGVLGAPSVNPNDPSSNPILAYAINKGVVLSTSYLGGTGLDFIGFGKFSTDFPIGGIMMRDPTNGNIWIYDITKDSNTLQYGMSASKPAILGSQLGSNATAIPVGLAPLNGNLNETDLVLQDKSGNLYFYDIQKDAAVSSGLLMKATDVGQPFTEAFGADLSVLPLVPIITGAGGITSSTAVSQLAQAMAGFGGSSGAAAELNAAPLGADTSQQQSFLTAPQHA